MPNKHFCQGPTCHEQVTQDRFLKSRGVIRGRYALWSRDQSNEHCARAKYFCSTRCESSWLDVQMENIEQGRPIEFIRHRRETGGYHKITEDREGWQGTYTTSRIERVDNRTEID
jgi:hypothetical protein